MDEALPSRSLTCAQRQAIVEHHGRSEVDGEGVAYLRNLFSTWRAPKSPIRRYAHHGQYVESSDEVTAGGCDWDGRGVLREGGADSTAGLYGGAE